MKKKKKKKKKKEEEEEEEEKKTGSVSHTTKILKNLDTLEWSVTLL